jgi:hypothetical protein
MNINLNIETKKVNKKVTFSTGTKQHDGQTEKNNFFCKIVLEYFKGLIKNEFDIYKIIRKDKYIIISLLTEALIILTKLNKIKKDEYMYSVIKNATPGISIVNYFPKDLDEVDIMKKWDTDLYNKSAYKKTNSPIGIGLARRGSRIYSEKLTTVHIPHLVNFIKILLQTCKLVLKKNF